MNRAKLAASTIWRIGEDHDGVRRHFPNYTPPPPPPPPPTGGQTWEQMVAEATTLAQSSQASERADALLLIESWFPANTGLAAAGIDRGDLQPVSTLTPTQLANYGVLSGSSFRIREQGAVIDGLSAGIFDIQTTDVTIRNSLADPNGVNSSAFLPGADSTNWRVEFCDAINSNFAATGHYDQRVQYIIRSSRPGSAKSINAEWGFKSGYRCNASDSTFDAVFTPHCVRLPGSHNTGFTVRSELGSAAIQNFTLRRSCILDGTSSCFAAYTRSTENHDNYLIDENIFGLSFDGNTDYCVNRGGSHGGNPVSATNFTYSDNIFMQYLFDSDHFPPGDPRENENGQPKPGGESGPWRGMSPDVSTGNRYLNGVSAN